MPTSTDAPLDSFTAKLAETNPQIHETTRSFAADPSHDETPNPPAMTTSYKPGDKLSGLLKYGSQVLRFYMAWDDRSKLYGELRPFILHYYLRDQDMEIREVRRANSGRDPFPLFLNKGKVFKDMNAYLQTNAPTTHTAPKVDRRGVIDPSLTEKYTETDFAVGKTISINGVDFFIHGCDEFTRKYYHDTHGQLFEDIPLDFDKKPPPPKVIIPPHIAPGSEEDTLNSLTSLVPKQLKKDAKTMLENDGKIMRFNARLKSDQPEDIGRVFCVKFFLSDNTVGVFEPPGKNTGIVGGKFLERTKMKRPDGEYFKASDFYTGIEVTLNCFTFVLYQADEYTLSLMESDPKSFPFSSMDFIREQLEPVFTDKMTELVSAMEAADDSSSGHLPYVKLHEALNSSGVHLSDQVLITLLRRYDTSRNGRVCYSDVLSLK